MKKNQAIWGSEKWLKVIFIDTRGIAFIVVTDLEKATNTGIYKNLRYKDIRGKYNNEERIKQYINESKVNIKSAAKKH